MRERKTARIKTKRAVILIMLAALFLAVGVGVTAILSYPEIVRRTPFPFIRVKNFLSFIFAGKAPVVYFIDVEKNGTDIRLMAGQPLIVTYRDEFVIKNISSDVPFGRGITADVEDAGGEDDFRKVIRGIDLINRAVLMKGLNPETQSVRNYTISVRYRGRTVAAVPLEVRITPQDWLRCARNSDDPAIQIEYLEKALSMNGADAGIEMMLASLYARTGRTGEALRHYQDILRRRPDDLAALLELLKCFLSINDYERALAICARIDKILPRDAANNANMALAWSRLGKWDRATVHYEKSLGADPANDSVRSRLAEAYEKAGKTGKAVEQYRIIVAKSPNSLAAMLALADSSLRAGNFDEAIKWYTEISRRQPRNAIAFANLGLAYGGRNLREKEIENYRKALALNPKDPVTHYNLAAALEKLDRNDEAAAEYARAIQYKPNDVEAMEMLAGLHMRRKKFAEAVQIYEKLVKLLPRKASAYASLGFAYGELKKYRNSAEYYEKSII